jgi:hypothetical protein
MGHVFISYSSDERELADGLCAGLEERDLRCWIAPRDIPAGAVYASAIVAAIESADAFVLLLTASANESDHVFRELELATASDRRIVPALVAGVRPSRRIRFLVASIQWLDADADAIAETLRAPAVPSS